MFDGHSLFHESYYEHSCSVLNEKDVLYTDIKQSWCTGIKRWWYNFFLLSYNDERCRIYYTSSHAMRLERKRQFRRHRGRIHPLSKFSNFWNALILIIALVNRVFFHHNTTILFMDLPKIFHYMAVILEFILLFDVLLNFKMGYIEEEARRVVLNARRGCIHYVSTKLFLYVSSTIPLQTIMLLRYGMNLECNRCKANRFVSVIKLLGVIGLYRVFDATKYWSRERATFKATYFFKFLRICILGFVTMLQYLNVTEAVSTLIMIEGNEINEKSYFALMMRYRYWLAEPPTVLNYLSIEFSLISKSVFLFGYGLKPRLYYLDALLGLLEVICANIFYMWGLVECYAVVNRLKYSEDQMNIHRDRSMNMMRCRRLSNKISAKLDKYYDINLIKLVLIENQNDLYHCLPSAQRKEIKLSSYGRYIKRIPYFSEWPSKLVEGIVLLLKQEVFLEHDVVANMWKQGDGLVILQVGMMAVYSAEGEEMGHLIDGDYFGEITLITNREIRTSAVIAVTPSLVMFLPKISFREYMKDYPELFFAMRRQLREKYADLENTTITPEKAQDMMHRMKEQKEKQHQI